MGAWLVDECDPGLHRPALAMGDDDFGPDLYLLLRGMLSLMYQHHCVGLAACQIGIDRSVIAWDTGNGPSFAANPVVIASSDALCTHLEGCLSIPERAIAIERPREVDVSCRSLTGDAKVISAAGLLARVLQHEVDHVRGITILDHIDRHLQGAASPTAL